MILGKNPAWVYTIRIGLRSRPAKANMGDLFNTFLLMLLGLSLTPIVLSTVEDIVVNATGIARTIINLVPLMWVFIILGIGAAAVYAQFHNMG